MKYETNTDIIKKVYERTKGKNKCDIINLNNYYNNKKYYNKKYVKNINIIICLKEKYFNKLILLFIMIFYMNIPIFYTEEEIPKYRQLNPDFSEIIISFNKSGQFKLIKRTDIFPDQIIINDEDLTSNIPNTMTYNFGSQENTIILRWYYQITNCSNMFENLGHIIKIDLSKFNSSQVIDTSRMFYKCENLLNLNMKNFDTSLVTNMKYMFLGCRLIPSFDLSNFNTSNVRNMEGLFSYNYQLNDINLNNFDTSLVTDMNSMFMECTKLKFVNLSNFKTNSLTHIYRFFYNCKSLVYFDLSSFNTSEVKDFNSMFYGCENLKSINIKNFNTSNANNMNWMFMGCIKLTSLDISHFDMSNVKGIRGMFNKCENLQYLNLNNLINLNLITDVYSLFYNCTKLESIDLSFLNISKIINMDYMFYNCENLKYLNIYNFNTSSITSMSYMFSGCKSLKILNIPLFVENKVVNITNMFNNISNDLIYCIKNNSKALNIISLLNEKQLTNNCSNICFSENINYFYEQNKCICREDIQYETIKEHFCLEECNPIDFLQKICRARNNNLNIKIIIINNIREYIKNGNLNVLLSNVTNEEKKDIEIFEDNIIYQISSSYNQNNKNYQNISVLKFKECENILKTKYNINQNDSIIIFKVDIYVEGLLMPIVEYELYHPITFQKLNLDICQNSNIEISVPVYINEEELFKHSPSSSFYNDICYPCSSENNTDITLHDRQLEFVNKNLTLCENNCKLIEYNHTINHSMCECKIKNEINIINDIKIDKDKLLKSFIDIKSIINIEIMKCYYILLSKEGIIYNIGSYIILIIIIIFIVFTIIFILKGYKLVINKIEIIFQILSDESVYSKDLVNKKKKNKIIKCKTKIESNNYINKDFKKEDQKIKIYNIKHNNNENNSYQRKEKELYSKSINNILKEKNVSNDNYFLFINNKMDNTKINLVLNDYELNSLLYIEAIKLDNRTYFQYYLSLLRTKHIFILAFFPNNDYNSPFIKICLFFFSFSLFYTVNALFFTENKIHQIYEDLGKYNFIYNLSQIFYSTIISSTINTLIKYFSLSEKEILKLKKEKNIINFKNKVPEVIRCLKIKFICFFVFSFIFLIVFWYYLSCFNAVYKNSQIYLIKDTLYSFLVSMLYPFALNLIPGVFRISSLTSFHKDKECIYKFSKIIQII